VEYSTCIKYSSDLYEKNIIKESGNFIIEKSLDVSKTLLIKETYMFRYSFLSEIVGKKKVKQKSVALFVRKFHKSMVVILTCDSIK